MLQILRKSDCQQISTTRDSNNTLRMVMRGILLVAGWKVERGGNACNG